MTPNEALEKLGQYTTTISFKYEYAYAWTVSCLIDRYKTISVQAFSITQEDSLERALKLLDKLKVIEAQFKLSSPQIQIIVPDLSSQPYEGGYEYVMVDNTRQFVYKRINNKFYLTQINTITHDGFVVLEQPFPINSTYKFIKTTPDGDLYEWDDLGLLCGAAGLAYVKDGYVISTKTTCVA